MLTINGKIHALYSYRWLQKSFKKFRKYIFRNDILATNHPTFSLFHILKTVRIWALPAVKSVERVENSKFIKLDKKKRNFTGRQQGTVTMIKKCKFYFFATYSVILTSMTKFSVRLFKFFSENNGWRSLLETKHCVWNVTRTSWPIARLVNNVDP